MDLNLVVVSGRVAAPPELREFESGTRLLRYLVTTRTEAPRRRVDVLPFVLWDPDDALVDTPGDPGVRIWVTASVQRRFWEAGEGRRSRLELVAHDVELRPEPADGEDGG